MLRDYTSFDLIATANLTEGLFTSVNAGFFGSIVVSPGNGRRSTNSLRFVQGSTTDTSLCNVRRTLDAQGIWGVGFAFKTSNVAAAAHDIFAVRDAGTLQVDFVLNPDGTITATRGGTTLGTTSLS